MKNPRYLNAAKSLILLINDDGEQYVASADDCEESGREIFKAAMNGDYGSIEPFAAQVPSIEEARAEARRARAEAVAAITVTTAAGNTFDGDEESQTRMSRAIIALQATSTASIPWVLSDNRVIHASAAELAEALALAGAAQAAIWIIE